MVEGWILWVLLVGLAVGAAGAWLFLVRLSREEDDVGADERWAEAAWISDVIERDGGVAPESLVEEVLELHQAYLRTPSAPPDAMLPPPAVVPPGSALPGAAPPPPIGAAPPPPIGARPMGAPRVDAPPGAPRPGAPAPPPRPR